MSVRTSRWSQIVFQLFCQHKRVNGILDNESLGYAIDRRNDASAYRLQ